MGMHKISKVYTLSLAGGLRHEREPTSVYIHVHCSNYCTITGGLILRLIYLELECMLL